LIPFRKIIILSVVAGTSFYFSNFWLSGTLNSKYKLGAELKSPPDSLYKWTIATQAPFKYRVLHRAIVSTSYNLVISENENNDTFLFIYRSEAFIFHCLGILLFYFFLIKINLSDTALIGAIVFALLPPLLLAYNMPVHTREDTMAYCILILGLLAIIKNSSFQILLFAFLGVICRETLLLIPFINLFYNNKQNIFTRLLITSFAFITFIGLRFYLGIERYDYWEGLRWNLNNIEQIIAFGFLSFGFLWIIFIWSFFDKKDVPYSDAIIYRSRIAVFLLVIATTLIGGIFNEIRLMYLLAPWIIPIGLQFYKTHRVAIVNSIKSKGFQIYGVVLFILFVVGTAYIQSIVAKNFISRYDISYSTWVVVASVQGYLSILCMPYFFRIIKATKS
jgi:hypothetical protein